MAPAAPSLETIDVVVLCGGRGTRLGALTATTPKPLLPVAGAPFLLHRLLAFRQEGCSRFILAVQHLADQFRAFAKRYEQELPGLTVIEESTPLGTGGALRHAAQHVGSPVFIAFNGDSWGVQPMTPVLAEHARNDRLLTMVVVRADQVEGGAQAKGMVNLGAHGEVLGFSTGDAVSGSWVNAGLYLLSRDLVRGWPQGAYDLEARLMSLIPPGTGYAFCSEASLLDIGIPACLARANRELALSVSTSYKRGPASW